MRFRRLVPVHGLLAVLFLSLGPSVTTAQDVFTPWNVARLKMASSAMPSPDGTRVAYLLSVPRDPMSEADGPAWQELHVVDVASGQDVTFISRESLAQPRWTPDGTAITFLAKRGNDATRGV